MRSRPTASSRRRRSTGIRLSNIRLPAWTGRESRLAYLPPVGRAEHSSLAVLLDNRPCQMSTRCGMMRRLSMLALVLALLTVYVALTPLAYADPPDPLWIGGFYDDDDNDDSIFVITSHLATVEAPPLPSWIPLPRSEPFVVAD